MTDVLRYKIDWQGSQLPDLSVQGIPGTESARFPVCLTSNKSDSGRYLLGFLNLFKYPKNIIYSSNVTSVKLPLEASKRAHPWISHAADNNQRVLGLTIPGQSLEAFISIYGEVAKLSVYYLLKTGNLRQEIEIMPRGMPEGFDINKPENMAKLFGESTNSTIFPVAWYSMLV